MSERPKERSGWEVTRPLIEPSPCRAVAKADGNEDEAVGVIKNDNRPGKK